MSKKEQINEVAPLVAALMGALVGMGLEKNKAKKAAQQAVNKSQGGSQGGSTWNDPDKAPRVPQGRDDAEQAGARAAQAVYDKNKAAQAAQAAPKKTRAPGGVLRNKKMIRTGPIVKELQRMLYGQNSPKVDGKWGPQTSKAVMNFQKNQGLKVDGIVGPNTMKRLEKLVAPDRNKNKKIQNKSFAPSNPRQDKTPKASINRRNQTKAMGTVMASKDMSEAEVTQINEEITISGSADDLIRMMQLAGAGGAKAVDAGDINPEPETPCGSKPEPDMGDMVRMMAPTEDEDGAMGDEYDDDPSAPDEVYMNDVSASIPHGDDLHKKKKSYPKAAGGDNPMALEDELRSKLSAALAEKKK